jgi:hypothetical protein
MNLVKQNQIELEIAKDRVRQSNIDGLFREVAEEEKEGADSSSSSSSFQERDDD